MSTTGRPSTPSLSFSSSSSSSSSAPFPRPLSPSKSDALKANPHPYPIRTTSTAVLSRSNSTTAVPHQYQYQYYVPQSPSKESFSSVSTPTPKGGGGGGGGGGRHRHSKSPLPLFAHKNRSMSSLNVSSESSHTKSEGELVGEELGDLMTAGHHRPQPRPRPRRRGAGKVRGIVASFEGRGGGQEDFKYRRERTGSDASSASSASSSFESFIDDNKLEESTTTATASTADGDSTSYYNETVKLLHGADVAYTTVTAASIRHGGLPIPTFSKSVAEASVDDELSVEELLALVSDVDTGASAWERERDGRCTVRRVAAGLEQVSPTGVAEREGELVQEMSETREMVRALSARVASVEAKIGEMEIAAGELEIRGRQLVVVEDDEDRGPQLPAASGEPQSSWSRRVVSRLLRMVCFPFYSSSSSMTSSMLPMWYKRSWACYLLFLGLGACAFVLREVVKRGLMLRGRRP